MPTKRKPVVLLPHRMRSGLFVKAGEFVADIKPDAGKRVTRRLGRDRSVAVARFERILSELSLEDDPDLVTFLERKFLPSQSHLKSHAFTVKCVRAWLRYLGEVNPGITLSQVSLRHVEGMRAFYGYCAPKTLNLYTQKLKQALNYAVELGILDTNSIARVKMLPVDNRRMRFLVMEDFVRILHEARNTDAHDLFVVGGLTGLRPSNVRLVTTQRRAQVV